MIRLFTALPLPDDLRTRLAATGAGIDGARWVPPENLHLTLRFIGEITEDRVDDIIAALDTVQTSGVTVTPDGAGCFGSRGKVRALWIGVRKTADLVALHDKIDRALVLAGFDPEGRKYTPHITIGRFRNIGESRIHAWLEAHGAFAAPAFDVRMFVLYESRLGRGGPVYSPVAEFPIA